MAGFPCKVQHEAIGKAKGRPRAEQIERRGHNVRILHCQILVIQQHLDGDDKVGRATFVHRRQDPRRLSKCENRYPGAFFDEDIRGSGLARIVPW